MKQVAYEVGGDAPAPPPSRAGRAAAAWAVAGVAIALAWPAARLAAHGIATIRAGLTGAQWVALVALTIAFLYGEGVRALDRRWVPFVLRNVRRLRERPRALYVVLAPLHAMAFVGAPTGTLVRAWGGAALIVLAVVIVRALPEPWRGIVDFAVSTALAWGTFALVRQAPAALRSGA